MIKPMVSILIPAFNAQDWIGATLKSALAQTWHRKEIIVVDDGSTDQTLSIAQHFASEGVLVISQKNQGAAAARNRALSVSQGEYIQWLDADDLLAYDKIEKQMEIFEKHGNTRTIVSSAWGMFIFRPHKAKFVPTALWCDLSPVEWLVLKMEHNLYMQTATWLVSRELTDAAGPWDTKLLGDDDGEYFCRVIINSDRIQFVPGARVFYRMPGPNSLSYVGLSDRKLDAQFRSMELTISYLRSMEDSERVRTACMRYLQDWLVIFIHVRPDIVKRFEQIAASLGGRLTVPRLPWKYGQIKAIFGWRLARRAQVFLPRLRWYLVRLMDKALWFLEGGRLGNS